MGNRSLLAVWRAREGVWVEEEETPSEEYAVETAANVDQPEAQAPKCYRGVALLFTGLFPLSPGRPVLAPPRRPPPRGFR